jgi:predicted Zn-ribbon and HTH transcriptional regulator
MDATGGLFNQFINYLFQSGDISVPTDYHDRCTKIHEMLDNDISGTINTILDYSVNSASEANYRIECSEGTLQKLLNLWLEEINIEIRGIPTGLQALSKEYFRERWQSSSFCILRVKDWQKITVDNVTIEVPTTMWFVNGGSIYVARPKDQNYKLGSDKFYLDGAHKVEIPNNKEEEIVIQKPYNRWFDEYATPYLIRKGIYKNWLGMKILQDKSDEVISKILPYLFLIQKGTENLFLQGDVNYSDDELKELTENFKTEVQKYRSEKGKTPTNAIPFDTKYEHLIPDLTNVLKEELYRQGYRSILSGLGFIDMLEISPSRQESRLNPRAFISEVNEGVSGFKAILLEAIYLIEERNKNAHKKLFTDKGKIIIVNSPLRINVENLLADLRSGFDRGSMSIQSYQEILGLDPTTEKERRKKELENGDEDLFYPHLIVNQEAVEDRLSPAKPKTDKKENLEDENKQKNTPETKTKTAELEEKYIAKCKKCGHEFDYLSIQEAGMGYVKCPKCEEAVTQDDLIMAPYQTLDQLPSYIKKMNVECQKVFMATFNSVLKDSGDESRAMAIGISAAKRCMKKKGYTYDKETKTWKKKE